LTLSSPNRPTNNYQHRKKPFTSTTTTQQTPNQEANQKQTLENNQKKRPLHTGQTNNYQRENKKDCNKIGIKQKRKAKQPKI
jgi:hypothetical protein